MLPANNKNRRHRPMAEINVVPYIDVMLVLLVIFMITAPLLTQGIKVDLPKAEAKAISKHPKEPIIVSVDKYGKYYLNITKTPNRPISERELFNDVQHKIALEHGALTRQILVKGDQKVSYGKVVEAMVVLKKAGANKVGLVTSTPNQKHS